MEQMSLAFSSLTTVMFPVNVWLAYPMSHGLGATMVAVTLNMPSSGWRLSPRAGVNDQVPQSGQLRILQSRRD